MVALGAWFCWTFQAVLGPSQDGFSNGIQEVVGSTPIGSTTLRSGTPELQVASHFDFTRICRDATTFQSEGCPRSLGEGGLSFSDRSETSRASGASHFFTITYVVMEHFSGANG
jgi:hypothetical protein